MVAFLMAVASVTLYGCSAGLCAFRTIRKSDRFPVAARLLFLAAFLLHSASIGMESVSTSGTILQGPNILMLASWVLALVSLFVSVASRRAVWVSGHRVGNGIAFHPVFPDDPYGFRLCALRE